MEAINSFLAKMFRYKPAVTKELAAISCDNFYYSADKARKELQLPSTPMEVAFKECFEWYKDNGYLNKNKNVRILTNRPFMGKDEMRVFLPISAALVFFVVYWFTAQSEKIKSSLL